MAKLRVYQGGVTSASGTAAKLRVFKGTVSGATATAPKLRILKGSASGTVMPVLVALDDRTVEPSTTVTITATPASGSATPTSYSWRVVSGAYVWLTASGASVSFRSPGLLDGAETVIGVKGVIGGVESPERMATVTSRPQISWVAADGAWIPVGTVAL